MKLAVFFIFSITYLFTDGSASVHNPFYCYSLDPVKPQIGMFSTISTYETNRGRDAVDPNVSTCTPSKFWFVSRHGTRLPSRTDLSNIFQHSGSLKDDIIRNYEAGRTTLCGPDFTLIRNWQFDPNITLEMEQFLTVAGWNEFQELAQRFQHLFPSILPPTYSTRDYFFRTTHTERTLASMKAFADGLFGHNGYQQVVFDDVPGTDPFMRPHDFCPLFSEVIAPSSEQVAFMEGPEYQAMLTQVSQKLGFHGSQSLRPIEIEVLNNLCRFEKIWNVDGLSPMCSAFSISNYEVLEYSEDLYFYYRYGYGYTNYRTLFENLNCYLMQDLMQFIQSDNTNDHKARLYGAHTANVQLLLVTLGIYEDENHLTRHNFAQQTNRLWATSRIAAKGTNLVIVKYTCDGEDNDILFLHSERPLQLPGCQPNGLCKQSYLLERFSRFLTANCSEMYCRNS